MDERLKKIIDDNLYKFSEWIKTINEYNSRTNQDEDFSEEQQVDLVYKTSGVLIEICEVCFKYGAFKDKFDTSKMYLNSDGLNLIIKSTKTENEFYFGIDYEGIYLNTHLRYSKNLRHMDDGFYKEIFALMDLGDFNIQEHLTYGSEIKKSYNGLYNNHKSQIFRLLRDYIIDTIEDRKNTSLGRFHIRWTYDDQFYDVVHNACSSFKILYKLNYMLWKVSDLETKKR